MKIVDVENIVSKKPVQLPGIYKEAWSGPDGPTRTSFNLGFCRITTDEGIVGYGPMGGPIDQYAKNILIGSDPLKIEAFWEKAMTGRDMFRGSYGGIDTALWDILGKAAGMPVYKLLGAKSNKVQVYAATTRLLPPEEHVRQAIDLKAKGFRAIKFRFHREDIREDLEVIKQVRAACGDSMIITVDANQNNRSAEYNFWTRETARFMCRELQRFGVYFFEEPLNLLDYDGLAELSREFDMYIAGGEHLQSIYHFREHLYRNTFDILQPDIFFGNIGITGMLKLGHAAEFYNKQLSPHVCLLNGFAFGFAGTASACAALSNCPLIEFPEDPPFVTAETQQFFLKTKFEVDSDESVAVHLEFRL